MVITQEQGKGILEDIQRLARQQTWRNTLDAAGDALEAWTGAGSSGPFGRIIFTGCGTSYYAGLVGAYLMEHVVHIPAVSMEGFYFATYAERALLDPQTLVVGLSATGGTEAVLDGVKLARQAGASTLCVTADPASDIANQVDTVIPTGEALTVAVTTRAYVQTLIALYQMAFSMGRAAGRVDEGQEAHFRGQIAAAAETVADLIESQASYIAELAHEYANASGVFVLGTGSNIGTAEEGSLKIVEMAKIFSQAQELENFLHGRFREVDTSTPMIFAVPHGPGIPKLLDFLTVTNHVQAPSIVITDDPAPAIDDLGARRIRIPTQIEELFSPLVYIVPIYLFAYYLAAERGYDQLVRRYPSIFPQKTRYSACVAKS